MCIINMDHHCPWMCNCIGHYNKKYFLLFLWTALYSMLIVGIFGVVMLVNVITDQKSTFTLTFITYIE